MSLPIERRLIALENISAPDTRIDTIIRHYVRPGHLDDEIYLLTDNDGNAWTRQPGETEDALIDRASNEVKRSARGFGWLSGHCEAWTGARIGSTAPRATLAG